MSKVYIAAPFFNPEQIQIVERIKEILSISGIEYFSPKDVCLYEPGKDTREILSMNCIAINNAPFIIVVTDGKDVGTMWEAGYAYSNCIPIIYVWLGWKPELKFNLMLAASGKAAVNTFTDLSIQIAHFNLHQQFNPEISITNRGAQHE